MTDGIDGDSPRRRPRISRLRAALVVLVVLGTAGCGSTSTSIGASGTTTTTPPSTTTPSELPPGALIAQVTEGGGLLSPAASVRILPSVTVLGDGTVFVPGVIPEIFPGPAILPIQEGHIAPARVIQLLADARRLGLLDGTIDYGRPSISDNATTELRIGNGTRIVAVHSAYALNADVASGNLTSAQRDARRALQTFVTELQSLSRGDQSYPPRSVAVFSITGELPTPAQPTKPWPIATQPAPPSPGEPSCVVVKGAEISTLLAALANANQNTPWKVGSRTALLAFRALVPGDAGCPTQ